MMTRSHLTLLRTLYTMGREDIAPDLMLIARELGVSCAETDRLLVDLETAGLVDADRVRLTLSGLAVAVSARGAGARRQAGRTIAAA